MAESPTLVSFYEDWTDTGETSAEGMPVYRRAVWVRLSRPPYLEVTRMATEEDQHVYPEPWRYFEKQEKARKLSEGYPLASWTACNEADVKMLAGHDIYTVEDLAKLAKSRDSSIPGEIKELAGRAARMMELQKSSGKHEAIITRLEREKEVLEESLTDARNTIASQKSLIDTLRQKVA